MINNLARHRTRQLLKKYNFENGWILIFFLFVSFFGCIRDKREKLPSFSVLMIDSTTIFNTDSIPNGKPFVLVYFSPDCEHCQKQVEEILKNMNNFEGIQFYLFTPFEFALLKPFYNYYHLYNYANITIGYDYKSFALSHFKITSTPWVFIYNKNKKLVRTYQGGLSATELIEAVSKT